MTIAPTHTCRRDHRGWRGSFRLRARAEHCEHVERERAKAVEREVERLTRERDEARKSALFDRAQRAGASVRAGLAEAEVERLRRVVGAARRHLSRFGCDSWFGEAHDPASCNDCAADADLRGALAALEPTDA